MSRHLPNLNALRAFEAAARHLSFSRAADELCVTQGSVSRHVKALETHLGVALFRRLTRAVELTESGREYLPACRSAFDQIEQSTLRIRRQRRRKSLTVSVLPTLAMYWLIPRLAGFMSAHPDIEVRMITSIKAVDFAHEDVDVAIRVGQPPLMAAGKDGPRIDLDMVESWDNVHADLLMPDVLVPVCAPELLPGGCMLRAPQELSRFTLLHTATRSRAWPDWCRAVGISYATMNSGPAFGHFFMTLQAAMEGRGIALIPQQVAAAWTAGGKLRVALDARVESAGAYYFLCRAHQRDADNITRFRDWLRTQAALLPDSNPIESEATAA